MIRVLDKLALAGMATGILLLLSPWGQWPFRVGFFVALVSTVLHVATSHLVKPEAP